MSFRLAETLTFDEADCDVLAWLFDGDCAVPAWLFEGWLAGALFVVWLALLVAGWFWLLAGGAVLVCAWEPEFCCGVD